MPAPPKARAKGRRKILSRRGVVNIKVAVVTAFIGLVASEALAQPGWYRPFADVPPYEVMRLVRARGLTPVSRPVMVGPNYIVHATDRNGDLKRVVVDAEFGDILRVVSLNRPPPPSAPPAWARPPRSLDLDDDDVVGGLPPAAIPQTRPRTAAVTPLPRPRPALAAPSPVVPKPDASEQPASKPDAPAAEPAPVTAAAPAPAPRVVLPGGPAAMQETGGESRSAAPAVEPAAPDARAPEPPATSALPPMQALD
jgi:hypothetical protein